MRKFHILAIFLGTTILHVSYAENNDLILLDTCFKSNTPLHGFEKYIDVDGYGLDLFQYGAYNNFPVKTKKDYVALCKRIGEEKLRAMYYKSIKECDLNRIVNYTHILAELYPSGKDLRELFNNVWMHDSMKERSFKYGDEDRVGEVSNTLTNRLLIHCVRNYGAPSQRRIPRKDFIWALSNLEHMKQQAIEKKIKDDLDRAIYSYYRQLDPYNLRERTDQMYTDRIVACSRTNRWPVFDSTTVVLPPQGRHESYELETLLRSWTKTESGRGRHPRFFCYDETDCYKYVCPGEWPKEMQLGQYLREIVKRMSNSVSIEIKNYPVQDTYRPVIEVRRTKTKREKELGW